MASSSFFNSPTFPPAQPKRGSANPRLQATDQLMAQQLAAMGNNPQAMTQAQRYQGASSGEQANMEAMQNLKGGWGEALSRLAAEAVYHGTKLTASAGPDVAADVSKTLDVFDATGRRLPATQIDPALVQAMLKPGHFDPTEGLIGANVGMEAYGGPVGAGVSLGARGLASGVNWLNAQRAKAAARGLATTFYGPSEATPGVILDARTKAQQDADNLARLLMGTYAGLDQPR